MNFSLFSFSPGAADLLGARVEQRKKKKKLTRGVATPSVATEPVLFSRTGRRGVARPLPSPQSTPFFSRVVPANPCQGPGEGEPHCASSSCSPPRRGFILAETWGGGFDGNSIAGRSKTWRWRRGVVARRGCTGGGHSSGDPSPSPFCLPGEEYFLPPSNFFSSLLSTYFPCDKFFPSSLRRCPLRLKPGRDVFQPCSSFPPLFVNHPCPVDRRHGQRQKEPPCSFAVSCISATGARHFLRL